MKTDLRVTLTKRLLKEGLLRSMAHTTISKITVSNLCKEAGVNRATFYNHYDSPAMVLKDIAEDYAKKLHDIYHAARYEKNCSERASVEACFEYLYEKKEEIKILFSENAENSISGLSLNIITENVAKNKDKLPDIRFSNANITSPEDIFLCSVITASAAVGLIQIWLTQDIKKTPAQIVDLLTGTLGGDLFS